MHMTTATHIILYMHISIHMYTLTHTLPHNSHTPYHKVHTHTLPTQHTHKHTTHIPIHMHTYHTPHIHVRYPHNTYSHIPTHMHTHTTHLTLSHMYTDATVLTHVMSAFGCRPNTSGVSSNGRRSIASRNWSIALHCGILYPL